MQTNFVNYIITLYFCIPFFLVTECKLMIIRGKRQIDPNFQYLNFPYQSPETMYPNLNNDPCIKLDVNDRVCPEQQYFGAQYYPQQMATHLQLPGNIIDNPGISSIWSLLYPQILSRQQQHPGYEVLWPYNYQQWIPPLPPAQPTNNEPQTTPHDQATNKSENNLGVATARSAPAVTNPETSSYSQEFDHVQNDPIKYNYQVVKTSASITNPKTVNIVRSFIDSHEVPEIKMREGTPSQAPTEEENVDRRENPVDNPSNEENKEENEDGDLSQTDVGRNNLNQDIHNIQVSQQNVQRQENTADNNTDIRANEKNRKPQNQPRNDGENEDEYYYEYLH